MRKLFALLLVASAFTFASCSGEQKTEEAATDTTTVAPAEEAPVDTTAAAPADSAAAPAADSAAAPAAH